MRRVMMMVMAPDDLDGELERSLSSGDELAGVAAVGPGDPDLGAGFLQVPQQRPGRVAVLDASSAAFTDWESMTAAVGAAVRPASSRTRSRS